MDGSRVWDSFAAGPGRRRRVVISGIRELGGTVRGRLGGAVQRFRIEESWSVVGILQ
ncbi:hypothetical protein [Alicyclobacillus dauci]|uniref:Uncharacterized protein n=1 Tax=Alicyclobacillus dauci TaxID=1475485 RepID=A0ABY6Z4R9_9BACL|nr:hypothetical protein [Alicyclobacillus dauci]WAH37196.1 hypothetical protein NZD86_01195 [Alicyclobacillus dauci]